MSNLDSQYMNALTYMIQTHMSEFIGLSNEIWQYAELGLFETKSADAICHYLKSQGFKIIRGVAGMPTAFIAEFGKQSPIIGFLAEYDALPELSQKTVSVRDPVKSGAPGHGCGHNLLGVGSVAAGVISKEFLEQFHIPGTIRVYGTPAEENADGKAWMVAKKVFEDVDIALTWHPAELSGVSAYDFQSYLSVAFEFKGITAHAAGDPFSGRSALDAVELMNVGCNYLREHIPTDHRLHYVIVHGGTVPNIVPDYAMVWYFIRALKFQAVQRLYERVLLVAQGAATMTETTFTPKIIGTCLNPIHVSKLEQYMSEVFQQVGPPKFTSEEITFANEIRKSFAPDFFDQFLSIVPQQLRPLAEIYRTNPLFDQVLPMIGCGEMIGGSSDVGDVSWVVPTAQLGATCYTIGTAGHSWQLVAQAGTSIGHKGMITAAKVLALTAIGVLRNPSLLQEIKQEFQQVKQKAGAIPSILPPNATPPYEFFHEVFKIPK